MHKTAGTAGIKIRPNEERGHADHGWLKSYHTFSFADYYDPAHMEFRTLRVINEDFVAPKMGFGMHPHKDMEIVTIVLEGELAHKDSMGNTSVIKPGEVQRMSAGTGVTHSEFNNSKTNPVHLYQIWILPSQKGMPPSYEQKSFRPQKNSFTLVASPNAENNSVTIHQDAKIFLCELENKKEIVYTLAKGRGAWVQVKSGELAFNGLLLKAGDGAAIDNEIDLVFLAKKNSGFILFDLV